MKFVPKSANDILLAAIDKATPAERAAFLDEACAGNAELRLCVEALLRAHDESGNAPDRPAGEAGATVADEGDSADRKTISGVADPSARAAGSRVGPYKLLQKLGQGGMGAVWVAEQQEPVRRRVALKLIKPGLDSAQILRRFEAERQALALMDHVNIAKVLDAGTTESGRPYFVMELVQGVPITRYCDELHLPVRDRLALFVPVCQAIQHAHQKGIIHRDVKPSNVLVCMHDGRPVPKVIDFGVAKALHQRLTDESIYTEIGAIVGTLEYMSPEQAEMSPLGVDTRADVYALGVLFYELLTGFTPLDRQRLREAPYSEIVRLIKEEMPSKPSTRLTQSRETLADVAALRRTEPVRLRKELRGDLDWIAMKALEKDRTRRYETASGLARDVERYLNDEPVEACPPSAGYRLMKFVRRNKGIVRAVTALFLLLVAGILGTTWGLVREDRARHEAEQAREAEAEERQLALDNERQAVAAAAAEKRAKETAETREAETRAVLDFVENKIFAAARPERQEGGLGREVTLRKAVEAALPFVDKSFRQQPLIEARLRMSLGTSYLYLGEAKIAAEQFRTARALYTEHLGPDHRDTLSSMNRLADSYYALARHTDALKLNEETLARMKAALGPDDPDTLRTMSSLAASYHALGRYTDALKLREETLELRKARLGPDHLDTLGSMHNLANSYGAVGRLADAIRLDEVTVALARAKLGPDHPFTLWCVGHLANSYDGADRHADALKLHEETLERRKATLGPDHPDTLWSMNDLADCYRALGRHADALSLNQQTLAIRKVKLGPDHPATLVSMHNLATGYSDLGRHAEALKLGEETLALMRAKLGPDHSYTLSCLGEVADSLVNLGRGAEAIPLIDECVQRATGKVVDPTLMPEVMALRIRHFEKAGDAAGCRTTAEMWEKLGRTDADSLYNAACFRAVTASAIRSRGKSESATREADREADRAMTWLRQAIAAGFKNVAVAKKDKDLDVLRDREDFKKLFAEMEAKAEKEKK